MRISSSITCNFIRSRTMTASLSSTSCLQKPIRNCFASLSLSPADHMGGGWEFIPRRRLYKEHHKKHEVTRQDMFLDQGFMKTIGYKCYMTGQSEGAPEVPPNAESCSFLGS